MTIRTEIDELTAEFKNVMTLKVAALESEIRRNNVDRFADSMRTIQSFPHIQLLIKDNRKFEAIRELRVSFMESTEKHLDLYIAKKSVDLWASLFN